MCDYSLKAANDALSLLLELDPCVFTPLSNRLPFLDGFSDGKLNAIYQLIYPLHVNFPLRKLSGGKLRVFSF